MNLAQRFQAGEDITGEKSQEDYTFLHLTCGHNGNCPCAGREVTVTASLITFSDGSIYYDGIGEGSVSDEDELMLAFDKYEEDYYDQWRSW